MLCPPGIIKIDSAFTFIWNKNKIFPCSNFKNFCPSPAEMNSPFELKQLQCIPFSRIVACSNYYSTVGLQSGNCYLNSGSCCQSKIGHRNSQTLKCCDYQRVHHRTRFPGIAPYNNSWISFSCFLTIPMCRMLQKI